MGDLGGRAVLVTMVFNFSGVDSIYLLQAIVVTLHKVISLEVVTEQLASKNLTFPIFKNGPRHFGRYGVS